MTDMEIYGLLSEDEWRTRDDLMSMSGMKDRPIRAALNRLRKNWRTMIISSSNGKGYKKPKTEAEVQQCLNESRSRVKDEIEKQRALERVLQSMRQVQRSSGQLFFDFGS